MQRFKLTRQVTALAAALLLGGCIEVSDKTLLSDNGPPMAHECTRPSVQNSPSLPSDFSLLSWNIYKQQGDWQAELDQWLDNSDLLLLQEANASDALHQWLRQQGYHWFQVAAFNWDDVGNGVLTAAKGQPSEVCGKRLLEPATRIPKSILFSYYPLQGSAQPLLLVNLHAINFSLRGRTYNEQLDMISQKIGHYTGPVIVAGDFNRWNERRKGFLDRWVTEERLVEALPQPDVRTRFFGYPLDAVFYRGLTLETAQSMKSEASDHGALQMRFRVP